MSKVVLALVPHPDDAEFYAGGLLAKLAAEGARVHIVVTSDGGRGSFEADSETLIATRAEEMRRAAAALGAEPPILLGHPDGELDKLPAGVLREQFIRAIRQFRPDVVIAQDPYAPFEPHPDHRVVAWAATEALNFARLPLYHPEHLAAGLGAAPCRRKVLLRQRSGADKQVCRHKRASVAQTSCVGRAQEPNDLSGGRRAFRGGSGRAEPAGDVR